MLIESSILAAINVLADSDDGDGPPWTKILPFVLIVAFWIIGALVTGMKKRSAQTPRPTTWQGRPDVWPGSNQPGSKPAPQLPPPVPRQKSPSKRRPPPMPSEPIAAEPRPSAISAAVARPHSRKTSLRAAEVRAWLRPVELRKNYPITEIFEPPIGMRRE